MLIPDLLNILFDQADFPTIVLLGLLNKRRTTYANKYSLLNRYNLVGERANSCLLKNCDYGRLKVIKYLVNNGANIDKNRVRDGMYYSLDAYHNISPICENSLEISSSRGNLEIIKYLLDCGAKAKVCASNIDVLIRAVESECLQLVKYFACAESHNSITLDDALRSSVKSGSIDITKYLVDIGANVKSLRTEDYYAENGNLEMIKYLHNLGADINQGLMIMSAENGHLEVVKYLIGIGINPRADEDRVLKLSLKNGQTHVARYLMEHYLENIL